MNINQLNNLSPYFENYVKHVTDQNLLDALVNQKIELASFFKAIPQEKELYKYDVDKWTIKELLQHMIDTERVFAYRALCFSRNEAQDLTPFDENDYVANSDANNRSFTDLISEFEVVRESTILLYKSFTNTQMLLKGTASGKEAHPLLYGFTIVGHNIHHQKIIKERYL
jgi:hypothetical protein